ncbi:MAG: hypothetical protein N2257_07650 [Thermodesulfovibrionales bacterium]|nr:hypothetical protein [Thermodesulfovibrionales bacterium]
MANVRGKSLEAIAKDISDGYLTVNPIFLKSLDEESIKGLYQAIQKIQSVIRGEKFPFNDIEAIRTRNMRLQRLHLALVVLKNFARERKIILV